MNTKALVISGVVVVVVGSVGYWLADTLFLQEYRKISADTATLRSRAESFTRTAKGTRDLKIGLRDFSATTLGSEQNIVEHRLRGMLSELAEQNGLSEVVVTHGRPRVEGNPADDRSAKLPRSVRQKLGQQVDFAVVRGRVQGIGTLEQVMSMLASMRAQAWVHRVDGFTLAPKGRDGGAFELKVDYATVFAPDLSEPDAGAPAIASASASDVAALGRVVSRAPFRFAEPVVVVEAPKPAPVEVPVVVTPPPPPPPPYDKWRVTGVLETVAGSGGGPSVEVLLVHTDTGEARTLVVGQGVLGATLTGAAGEYAWFEKDGAAVVVLAGETLDAARPAESVHSESAAHG